MSAPTDTPRGNAAGFRQYFRNDVLAGFLVFLIALPLCLGISLACGYPPIAGVFTAIIGAIVTTFISDSELTIKGPAAGLIVIAIGCIEDFGGDGMTGGFSVADMAAYKAALAVGVAAAVLQILFAIFRAGILGEFFPVSAVHGMLAAIGVIIIAKQFPVALGVEARGEPLELLGEIPHFIAEANPAIAAIGGVSLAIMFLWPLAGRRFRPLRMIPAPMAVLFAAVPMGMAFHLMEPHHYVLSGHRYPLGEQFLVAMPDRVFGMFDEITFPAFGALSEPKAWKWVMMFFIIGSLESLLSAKAIDIIDPWKRKTTLDRDVLAVGVGNLCASLVGGLPMISEIVRSKANIDNGARTRFANMWHGVFLLVCVALIPTVLHRIPLASLAAMLVYTGFRLAHPSEFVNVFKIGREQFAVFTTTLVAVLATDLLIGIAIGISLKMIIHLVNGVPLRSLFKAYVDVEQVDADTRLIRTHHSAVFSNWIPIRRQIRDLGLGQRQNVILDLSNTQLVDHSVMDKLHEMKDDFELAGLDLTIVGLESHTPLARHEHAARKRSLFAQRRITVVAEDMLEERLESELLARGAGGYAIIPCSGPRKPSHNGQKRQATLLVRIEAVLDADACDAFLDFVRAELLPQHAVTVCAESVQVVRQEPFVPVNGQPRAAPEHVTATSVS
ncbi:C4-dicarboxylic acid transporter DauA [Maioricimonas rarisocia]|uniref:C4-dicarboxylic acid transporter DauA n=1 Tax=Maioricimonas rarisocia TaxID=2528026 RepID=A0A517Z513_9PLAN|nr:SulP family inorganic anion transporter [Maioricimonas rarisocia]QDU37539.1 C4-dicarboxylic acid transporter DauA [Maioricimonas rarisocia]